jgi:2-polyprenyl-3-methyl-5-hydroxy-6-metoxy-1,4-benzoquinol methylase
MKKIAVSETEKTCPVCLGSGTPFFADTSREYFRCQKCRILFNRSISEQNDRVKPVKVDYEKEYFNQEYKSSYGLTYLEDRPNIERLARTRLSRLRKCAGREYWSARGEYSLCDLGSAMGFFLRQAQIAGFGRVSGVEISAYGSSHTNKSFAISVENLDLNSWQPREKYQVVSMFYVLEHFPNPREILSKVSGSIADNGFLILSLPSTRGPHFYCQRKNWLESHPEDHFVDYSPASIKRTLALFGMEVVAFYPAAVRFERIFKVRAGFFQKRLWQEFWKYFSKIFLPFAVGDTLEVYARKKRRDDFFNSAASSIFYI